MRRIFLSLLVVLLISNSSTAQTFVFKVVANNGLNEVRPANSPSWNKIKKGDSFNNGDIVKVADKAYIALIHRTGTTFELIKPGEFKIEDLESNLDTKKKGLGSTYTEYVINSSEDYARKEDEVYTTRGAGSEITVNLPRASRVYGNKITVPWVTKESSGEYQIEVRNLFDDLIFTGETTGNFYELDLESPEMKEEYSYTVVVKDKQGNEPKSQEYTVDRLTGSNYDEIDKAYRNLILLPDEESAITAIVAAAFFEENNLLIDAINNYEKAIRLRPNIVDFEFAYTQFRARHKIK